MLFFVDELWAFCGFNSEIEQILPSGNSAGRLPRYIKDFFLCSTIASYRAHSMWASRNVGMTRQGRLVTRDKVPTYLLGFQTLMVGSGQIPEY